MKRFEDMTHVFILRIWLEPREGENKRAEFRGVIEHFGTTRRIYFNRLGRVLEIIRDITGFELEEIPD